MRRLKAIAVQYQERRDLAEFYLQTPDLQNSWISARLKVTWPKSEQAEYVRDKRASNGGQRRRSKDVIMLKVEAKRPALEPNVRAEERWNK